MPHMLTNTVAMWVRSCLFSEMTSYLQMQAPPGIFSSQTAKDDAKSVGV